MSNNFKTQCVAYNFGHEKIYFLEAKIWDFLRTCKTKIILTSLNQMLIFGNLITIRPMFEKFN